MLQTISFLIDDTDTSHQHHYGIVIKDVKTRLGPNRTCSGHGKGTCGGLTLSF